MNEIYKNIFSDLNECYPNFPCHPNATCNNTDGSYICTCDFGHSGDGFNCSGKRSKIIYGLK